MFEQKKYREISLEDLIETGVFEGVDFSNLRDKNKKEIQGMLDKGHQLIKKYLVKRKINNLKKMYQEVDHQFDLILTDYFKHVIEEKLTIIAERTITPGPEKIENKADSWYFEGFITYKEAKTFSELYPIFDDLYHEYCRNGWELELNIIGGIMKGHILIEEEFIKKWRDRGILIELYGFDQGGKLTSLTDLLVGFMAEIKKRAAKIKSSGPGNLQEAQILKLDTEREKMINKILNN
ncbi:MAG: hypothetical protein ACOCQA_00365 [bacterium]